MNKEKKNIVVPKLRFPEFEKNDGWNVLPLGNVIKSESSTLAQNNLELVKKGFPVYGASGFIGFTSNYIQNEDYIAIIKDGSGVGKLFLYEKHSSILGTLNYLKSSNNDDYALSYLYYLLQTINLSNFIKGSGIPHIYYSDYSKELIAAPSYKEQQKIASCLSSLDDLITAHTQKLDALKAHKKGLMQQLFPAEREKVPKLRFEEFKDSGEWVEDILSNISPAIFDGTHQTPKYVESGIPFYSVENIISGNKNKFISKEDYLIATVKNKPEKDDILMTRIGNIGFSKIIDWDFEFSVYVTLAVIKSSDQFNSYFLHSFFQSDYYQKEIKSKSLLNAVPCKINMDELRKTKVLLPPDTAKREQQKIAECLSALDRLIYEQGERVAQLKLHKKGLMQGLFPTLNDTTA